jgi:hypothetical protein
MYTTNHAVAPPASILFARIQAFVVLGGLVVSVLAIGPVIRWFKPGRG